MTYGGIAMNTAISLMGLVAVLFIAYGFDRWIELLRQRGANTFTLTPFLWFAGMANILFAGALLLLVWFVTYRAKRSRLVFSIFAVVGLLITFATAIHFSASVRYFPSSILEYLTPNSRVVYVSALITVTGIAGFVLSRPRNL
jgi:hypothetical protein